jgi:hypothetical protein
MQKYGRYQSEITDIDCEWRLILVMKKETIIYFEHLGFGWVLDYMMLKEIKLTKLRGEVITDTSLIKIIENMLIDNSNV